MFKMRMQTASAQTFTLQKEETKEITCRAHFISACWRHMRIGAILGAHPVRGDAMLTDWSQQHSPIFTTKSTDRPFFLWRFLLALLSHPGQSTTLLTCLFLQLRALNQRNSFSLTCERPKATLRLAAVSDTKQAGDLRGDGFTSHNRNVRRPLTQKARHIFFTTVERPTSSKRWRRAGTADRNALAS